MGIKHDNELHQDTWKEVYLVLASGACPKVLALDTTHVAKFRVWNFDTN